MTSESWHRRHALQIACQLPENHEDALIVLEQARQLVLGFLAPKSEPLVRGAAVVSLRPDLTSEVKHNTEDGMRS